MGKMTVRQMWAAKLSGQAVPVADVAAADWMKNRGAGSGGGKVGVPTSMQRAPFVGRVLGVDPSLRGSGLALIEFQPGRAPVLLRCETLKIAARRPMSFALGEIHRTVAEYCAEMKARHVALEQTIYVQNFQTAQILGAARGAAISAAALAGLDVFEYAPLRVKQAVVGMGRASKEQMQKTVMGLLGHGRMLAADEADAAGVALCHAFTWRDETLV